MRESVTGDDVYAAVMMLRTTDDRTVVLLEGDDDCDCLGPHIDAQTANHMPCHGSANLDRAMELVDSKGIARVLGIRDLDWTDVLAWKTASENVVYTDLHDLDASVLCQTQIGSRVALMFGQRDRVTAHLEKHGHDSPVASAARLSAEIGRLRLASERHGARLNTRDVPVQELYDGPTDGTRPDALITIVMSRTKDCSHTRGDVERILDEERQNGLTHERLSSGHDLGSAVAFMCRQIWGGSSRVGTAFLLKAARLALSCTDLQELTLYHDVVVWEERTGALVWSCPRASSADGAGQQS